MRSKTSYLFGEKANYQKSLQKFKGIESIYQLFDYYYLQLDLTKYKLFGEDFDNYGNIIIRGKEFSPYKMNLDCLEKHLSDVKLFQKILINNNKQQKAVKWRQQIKNDINTFLKILNKTKLSKINFNKNSQSIKNTKKIINKKYNNNENFSKIYPLNTSSTEKSTHLSQLQLTNNSDIKNKKYLSPIITHKQKYRKRVNNENNGIKGYNSFNNLYDKKCIHVLPSRDKMIKKYFLSDTFDKENYIKEKNSINKRIEGTLLIKNKIHSLEKYSKLSSNNFIHKMLKGDEQRPQFKKRFKYLISQYK